MIDFSYESILERLQNNLKQRLGPDSELLLFSTNQRILEAIAEELSEQMRYDEYLTREAKWETAQNLSSIMNQIDFFNYKPHRMIGARGTLTVSANKDFDGAPFNNIIIPQFTQFSSDELSFTSTEAVTLLADVTPEISVPVVQGEYRRKIIKVPSNLTPLELLSYEVTIDHPNVENFLYMVYVEGVKWQEVEHFSFAGEDTNGEFGLKGRNVYEVQNASDFSSTIFRFGDGSQGQRINGDDEIIIHYILTEGNRGEVLTVESITNVDSLIRDSNNNIVELFCKNNTPILGGSTYESIDSIRFNAPRALRLSPRLISKTDYQGFILSEGLAKKVTVWGETETNIDNEEEAGNFIPFQENLVFISALNYDGQGRGVPIPEGEGGQGAIRQVLNPIKSLTDIMQFVDPKITYLHFNVLSTHYYGEKFSEDRVRSDITTTLLDTYSIQNARFKQDLFFSQYYKLINSIPSVVSHETDLTLVQYIPIVGDLFSFNIETHHNNFIPTSFKIYMRCLREDLPPEHPYNHWILITHDIPIMTVIGNATDGSDFSITDDNQSWTDNEFVGDYIEITGGLGVGQTRRIISNTPETITVSAMWSVMPGYGSQYTITKSDLSQVSTGYLADSDNTTPNAPIIGPDGDPEAWADWDNTDPEADFHVPNEGLPYSFNLGENTFLSYMRGMFTQEEPELLPYPIQLLNGIPGDTPPHQYEIKIEFKAGLISNGQVRTNVIPTRRYQLYSAEKVTINLPIPISFEEEMGY